MSYETNAGEDLEKGVHIGSWEVCRGYTRTPALLKLVFNTTD